MKSTILARRYAKALFSLGKQEGKVEEYSEKLSAIAALYHDETAGIRDALVNPLYPLGRWGKPGRTAEATAPHPIPGPLPDAR